MRANHWIRSASTVTAAAALLGTAPALPEDILGNLLGEMERLTSAIEGDIGSLKEDVREQVAYFLGMESYVYGYPSGCDQGRVNRHADAQS